MVEEGRNPDLPGYPFDVASWCLIVTGLSLWSHRWPTACYDRPAVVRAFEFPPITRAGLELRSLFPIILPTTTPPAARFRGILPNLS